jgi:nitric oxide reductase large subunit
MFLVAVGFWNFLGAGIFGFLVNLPIVCYYEIGTALTAGIAKVGGDEATAARLT